MSQISFGLSDSKLTQVFKSTSRIVKKNKRIVLKKGNFLPIAKVTGDIST